MFKNCTDQIAAAMWGSSSSYIHSSSSASAAAGGLNNSNNSNTGNTNDVAAAADVPAASSGANGSNSNNSASSYFFPQLHSQLSFERVLAYVHGRVSNLLFEWRGSCSEVVLLGVPYDTATPKGNKSIIIILYFIIIL